VFLIFITWKLFARRSKIKIEFKHTLSALHTDFRGMATVLKSKDQENEMLSQQLKGVLESFKHLQQETSAQWKPLHVFSSQFLELVFRRLESQLDVVQSIECYELFQLSGSQEVRNVIGITTPPP
jgi:hypothetical protein